MAITTYIEPESIILSSIIDHISIDFNMEILETELRIKISEEKLLAMVTKIVKEIPDAAKEYTGESIHDFAIDRVHIKIGDYDLKAKMETEYETVIKNKGFKRIYNG